MCDILCTPDDIASTLSHHTTVFMMSHPLQAWHHTPVSDIAPPLSLSPQALHWYPPLYWWYHTKCISEITSDIIHGIWSILYFMTPAVWHHKTAFMISDYLHMKSPPGFLTYRPLYLWLHRHYVCEYMSTLFNIKHTVLRQYSHYIWNHNLHMCICLITHTLWMI